MKKKKVSYGEGDLFEIVLENHKKFLGLIIRRKGTTKLFLGYFWVQPAGQQDGSVPDKSKALTAAFSSGLGFEMGTWALLGPAKDWRREDWPIPEFKRYDDILKSNFVVTYNENLEEVSSKRTTEELAARLSKDSVYGYEALEGYLDRITATAG
jgi:hypothetical protein